MTGAKLLLTKYKEQSENKETNNLFSFFIEKTLRYGDFVSLIVPKSLINAPEFNLTRNVMERSKIVKITDFGEKAFKGVKIETISFLVNASAKPSKTIIESYITNEVIEHDQAYITDKTFPYWLIYRNPKFDYVADKMQFDIFKSFRDRSITKSNTRSSGAIRVLKSRNIASNEIISIKGYDCYIDNVSEFAVGDFLNKPNCVLVPNLTYYPRACFMPPNCICDGSVAILEVKDSKYSVTKEDLAYYATEEFSEFYKIARNRGTRSLNIDNNSVFFFGLLKK